MDTCVTPFTQCGGQGSHDNAHGDVVNCCVLFSLRRRNHGIESTDQSSGTTKIGPQESASCRPRPYLTSYAIRYSNLAPCETHVQASLPPAMLASGPVTIHTTVTCTACLAQLSHGVLPLLEDVPLGHEALSWPLLRTWQQAQQFLVQDISIKSCSARCNVHISACECQLWNNMHPGTAEPSAALSLKQPPLPASAARWRRRGEARARSRLSTDPCPTPSSSVSGTAAPLHFVGILPLRTCLTKLIAQTSQALYQGLGPSLNAGISVVGRAGNQYMAVRPLTSRQGRNDLPQQTWVPPGKYTGAYPHAQCRQRVVHLQSPVDAWS